MKARAWRLREKGHGGHLNPVMHTPAQDVGATPDVVASTFRGTLPPCSPCVLPGFR